MSHFSVGEKLTNDEFAYKASGLPVGSVVRPNDGSQLRVIADIAENDGCIFTDKSGYYGVTEFEIVYLPEPSTVPENVQLAHKLYEVFHGITSVSPVEEFGRDESPCRDWVRVADYVMSGYDVSDVEDSVYVLDGDGDIWHQYDNGEKWYCLTDDEVTPVVDLVLLDKLAGPLKNLVVAD